VERWLERKGKERKGKISFLSFPFIAWIVPFTSFFHVVNKKKEVDRWLEKDKRKRK
jgi:hypothetical protein